MNAPLSDAVRRALAEVTLDDKWTLDRGRAYMSGTQALLRLAMLQHQRDALAGLNTAGFISGYRGSPLGSSRPDRMEGAQASRTPATCASSPD